MLSWTLPALKDPTKRLRRQAIEKIFAHSNAAMQQRSSIYNMQRFSKLKSKKKKVSYPFRVWPKDMERHFTKDIQMTKKHLKRCSASLAIRKNHSELLIHTY